MSLIRWLDDEYLMILMLLRVVEVKKCKLKRWLLTSLKSAGIWQFPHVPVPSLMAIQFLLKNGRPRIEVCT